jgi:uncharacterized membrane protein
MMAAIEHRDVRIELLLGTLLRAGVLTAAAVVLLGTVVYLAGHGSDPSDYRTFRAQPVEMRSITGVLRGARSFDGAAIIQLGVLVLIATPVLRVASSAYAFAKQRDRRYVVITLVVLGLLSYGLLASR